MNCPALSRQLPLVAVRAAVLLWSMSFGVSSEVLKTASPAVLSVGRFMIGLLILVPLNSPSAWLHSGLAATPHNPARSAVVYSLVRSSRCNMPSFK